APTILPRTFRLFKEDKRTQWRLGNSNEWRPENLLSDWRKETRVYIRNSNMLPAPRETKPISVWQKHLSLDAHIAPSREFDGDTWAQNVVDENIYSGPDVPLPELNLGCLGARERALLEARFSEASPSFVALGREFGISGARAGQIVREA